MSEAKHSEGVSRFELTQAPSVGRHARLGLDSFQFERGPFLSGATVYPGLAKVRGFVAAPSLVQNEDPSVRHRLFLVDEDRAFSATVGSFARPQLLRHKGWLTEPNIGSAGFDGWVDLSGVPAGEYQLVAPVADHTGVWRFPVEVLASVPPQLAPLMEAPSVPTKRRMFEPGTSYSAVVAPGSTHSQVAAMVERRDAQRVLDCGCADGSFGAALRQRLGVTVHGLEYDPRALPLAQVRLDHARFADLESSDWSAGLDDTYDVVLFLDVLEHVRRPELVLDATRRLLKDDGVIIASIPNIAHVSQRVALLSGIWEYEDLGLLDRTHLRFFTKDTIVELFEESGYRIVEMAATAAPANILSEVPEHLSEVLEAEDETLFAYQYLVTASSTRAG